MVQSCFQNFISVNIDMKLWKLVNWISIINAIAFLFLMEIYEPIFNHEPWYPNSKEDIAATMIIIFSLLVSIASHRTDKKL